MNRDTLYKNEKSPEVDDGNISCAANDTIVAEYRDHLYGIYARDTVVIKDAVEFSYRFMETRNDKDLDSVETESVADFRIRVTALSGTVHDVDTLDLLLFTDGEDSLWVKAVETGAFTSTFEYAGSFRFVKNKSDLKDSELDGVFDVGSSHNRVKIQASLVDDETPLAQRDSLVVFSNYVPGDYAEIYDSDLDGTADFVRIHFTADLKEPFEYGVTSIDAVKSPYLKLSKMKDGFAQKLKVRDRVGAVPVKAVKYPGTVSENSFLDKSYRAPLDTLVVTMSEPIKNNGDANAWKKLFVFSPNCKDPTEYSLGLAEFIETDSAGVVWRFVMKTNALKTDDCLRTNPKALFVDEDGNSMGRGGVAVAGEDDNKYLYSIQPLPVVSGKGPSVEWIAPGEDEWGALPDSLTTIQVASVMPFTAYVTIYDGLSNVVATFEQKFGENGEMTQESRRNSDNYAKTGFLVWNKRSDDGRLVGSGVYIWRIKFKFEDGHSEKRIVKMGVKRKK